MQAKQSVVVDTRRGTVNGVVTRVDPRVTDGTVIVDVTCPGPVGITLGTSALVSVVQPGLGAAG